MSKRMPVRLMAFDLLYVRGRRITNQPLTERRKRLIELVGRLGHPLLIVPDCVVAHGMKFFAGIVRHRLEGMMAKRIVNYSANTWIPQWHHGLNTIRILNLFI